MSLPGTPGALITAEIREQPARWLDQLRTQRDARAAAGDTFRSVSPELIALVARGSSDNAALYGQYLLQNKLGIPAVLATPSTHTIFGTKLRFPRSVQVALSQSGQSPDLVSTVASLQDAGVPAIVMTNDATSNLAQRGNVHIDLCAGPEKSVAATKSYTGELLALYLLAQTLTDATEAQSDDAVAHLRELAEETIRHAHENLPGLVDDLTNTDRILVVGRGYSMATARESALKLMETCRIAASGWSAADATHGPLGQVDDQTVVIALTAATPGRDSIERFSEAAAGSGAKILEIGPGVITQRRWQIDIPAVLPDELLPLLEIIPVQVLSAMLSTALGLDPDRPRGLTKVTRTR